MNIGLSTWAFRRKLSRELVASILTIPQMKSAPLELAFHGHNGIEGVLEEISTIPGILDRDISLCVPPEEHYGMNYESRILFDILRRIDREVLPISRVVFPAAHIDDVSIFNEQDIPFCFENPQFPEEVMCGSEECLVEAQHMRDLLLEVSILRGCAVEFSLDLTYCYELDRSMGLAYQLLGALPAFIKEFRVSGMDEGCNTPEAFHKMHKYQGNILSPLQMLSPNASETPIIIHSPLDDIDDAEAELCYVLELLG